MTRQSTEKAQQFALVAENGVRGYTNEETARKALAEGGWTLNGSPVVTALTRPDPDSEWVPYPPASGGGA